MQGITQLITCFLLAPIPLLIAPVVLVWRKKILYRGSSFLACISSAIIIFLGLLGLFAPATIIYVFPWFYPQSCTGVQCLFYFPLILGLDRLSSYFLLMLGIVSLTSSIYMHGYYEHLRRKGEVTRLVISYPFLILFMYLVTIVQSLFWFLVFWEIMGFTTMLLIASTLNRKGIFSGMKYYLLTKGPAELMIAGGITSIILSSGNASYTAVSYALRSLVGHDYLASIVAPTLLLAGLMAKTGLIPLHAWVPEAYGESPTMASSLISGTASKMGVYMLFRLFTYFLPPTIIWGTALAVIGTATLVYGTLNALRQHDSKRLLAYHSMGQLGYVVLALGASIYLASYNQQFGTLLSVVAAAAALYHAFNHSLFKTLLFMSAGAAEYALGTRSLDLLGGLGRVMPLTSIAALIASFSISGLPPFNGFVSKWMIYASTMPSSGILPICGFTAMFISSVTSASFMKYYTSIFGRPAVGSVKESSEPLSMAVAMIILAFLCILFGVVPSAQLLLIDQSLSATWLHGIVPRDIIPVISGVAMNPSMVIAAIVFPLAGLLYGTTIMDRTRRVPGWLCGAEKTIGRTLPRPRHYFDEFETVFSEVYMVGDTIHSGLVKTGRAIISFLQRMTCAVEAPLFMALLACLLVFMLLATSLLQGVLPG